MAANKINTQLDRWAENTSLNEIEKKKLSIDILTEIEKLTFSHLNEKIDNSIWHKILYITSKYPYLNYLPNAESRMQWAEAAFKIIQLSNFTLLNLFEQRVNEKGYQFLFQEITNSGANHWSYHQIHLHVKEIASVFLSAVSKNPRVAIIGENSIETASCDLACLLYDIFDTPLNIHFKSDTLVSIFNKLKINIAVTDTNQRLALLEKVRKKTEIHFTIFVLDSLIPTNEKDIFFLGEQCKTKNTAEIDTILAKRKQKPINEVATTMFTSGSTGIPKGVSFSNYNLVSKRFARAAALPKVGNNEVLLCFLPLYHTFGRYLEMLGTIFWHGTYVFTGNPSTERLLSLFPKINPTGFISIPLRWMQLYEKAMDNIKSSDSKEQIKQKLIKITGERLNWGLSAAGYLDPKIFYFFQENNIHLCSGFGMTEGTGGITMTPPGKYKEGTTGIALPGINTRFRETNELEISGHYIARYLEDAGPGDLIDFPVDAAKDYWLPTGDIFAKTKDGYFEIVDRVKDIYKNNKGQTVAPRSVEKLFVDVPGIKRTFLVGDARPYNVLLIVPDNEDPVMKISTDINNKEEYFHQIITAANKDLAPYERVINFALLNRDFDIAHEELTPKGSFNRKKIEKNFKTEIANLYKSKFIELSNKVLKIKIPLWFFRDLGILENDIKLTPNGLVNHSTNKILNIRIDANTSNILIGDLLYEIDNNTIDLGLFTRQPKLWIGNPDLIDFCPCKEGWDLPLLNVSSQVYRPKKIAKTYSLSELPTINHIKDQKLLFVNNLISCSLFSDSKTALENTKQIGSIINQYDENITEIIRRRLEALANHQDEVIRTLAYRILLLDDPNPDYLKLFPAFIQSGLTFLNEESIHEIARRDMGKQHLESLRQRLYSYRIQLNWPADKIDRKQFDSILKLLFNFASRHLEYYSSVRAELSSWILHKADPYLSKKANGYFNELYQIFEKEVAKTTAKYSIRDWKKKLVFSQGISENDIESIMKILTGTPFLKQSVLLAYDERDFELSEIPDQGIWISRLMSYGSYKHYRLSINTNYGKHFDLHFTINKKIRYSTGAETVYWLAAISGYPYATLSLPALGCYRPKEGVLTTKFIGELTIWEKIREFAGIHHSLGYINIRNPWRKLFIKGLAVFYKAWQQSGYQIVPGAISPDNVIVPELDYLETATIISVAGLKKYENTLSLIKPTIKNFFSMLTAHYPWCKKQLDITWIFDACIEALGYSSALQFFNQLKNDLKKEPVYYFNRVSLGLALDKYLQNLSNNYYLPLSLFNAIDQYKEWEKINPLAVPLAKEQTIFELSGLYRIYRFPEIVRYNLYRNTYFANANPHLLEAFDILLNKMNKNIKLSSTHLIELSDLQSVITNDEDKIIFSRMVFSRLPRQHKLDIIKIGDDKKEQVVVNSYIKDKKGIEYIFREPLEPSEIGKLYRLFFEENYPKSISEMDKHMVVIDQQGRVIGGLCYIVLENHVVLLDGSAITTPLKGRGIGTAMIDTFSSRMASEGVKVIKAHFLLGNFYLKLDFKVDKKWGALVKFL